MSSQHLQFLNETFSDIGPRCQVEFRNDEGLTYGKLTQTDESGPRSIVDWQIPFTLDSSDARFRAFAEAAAENLRQSAERIGDDLTMEDVFDPAIWGDDAHKTKEQFAKAFERAWAEASWVWR